MPVTGLDHFVLTVADVERTCEFYDGLDGIEVVTFAGGRKALQLGEQKINLHETDTDIDLRATRPTPGSGDFCIRTETPIEELKADLEARGIEIVEGPAPRTGAQGNLRSIYFRDPDGNLVEMANEV